MSFSIEFDYRFDVENFFTPQRRVVLEEAAQIWSDLIQDDFDDVEAGHEFAVLDPQTFEFETIVLDQPIDDLLIFPSTSQPLEALGLFEDAPWISGFYSGINEFSSTEIGKTIGTKFEHRLLGTGTSTDFEPWLGAILVANGANWSFDDSVRPGEYDFLAEAIDMIGNVLGLRDSAAFNANIENGEFSGPNTIARFGGPIPVDEDGYFRPTPGDRRSLQIEDLVALADIGYEIEGFEKVGSVPELTTNADDIVYGTILADWIDGQGGDDNLAGGLGDDTLLGGAGDDTLDGQVGNNSLDGGAGNDVLRAGFISGRNVLIGGSGDDTLRGGPGQDSFVFGPGSGANLITGFDPNQDVLVLENSGFTRARQVLASLEETPDDTQLLTLRDGSTIEMAIISNADGSLLAGKNIRLVNDEGLQTGSVDADVMRGDGTANLLTSFGGDDTLLGAAGDDTLDGGSGADLLNGGPGSDIIYVDDAGDRVAESRRWDGEDTVISSVDFRMGRSHIENLELTGAARLGAGNGLRNQITGNDADNVLDGGGNVDTLTGGAGDDRYFIRSPGDMAIETAGGGTDTVLAFRAHKLEANIENLFLQTVRTRDGDPVQGINGIGNDLGNVIVGNPFDNLLSGRGGRDTLKGQGGADTFVFDQAPGAANADRVVDFDASEGDAIWLRAATFGLERGALAAGAFRVGDAALDAGDRVIFNEGTGQLWFDADGAGGASQQLVATFLGGAEITAADIEII